MDEYAQKLIDQAIAEGILDIVEQECLLQEFGADITDAVIIRELAECYFGIKEEEEIVEQVQETVMNTVTE